MKDKSYRLKTPTLGIISEDGHRIPVTIPMNAIVRVAGELDGNHLLDVIWEGKPLLMFTTDLRERGEPVDGAGG